MENSWCLLRSDGAAEEAISLAGPANFAGKTLMDTTNPIAAAPPVDRILAFTTGPNESLAEKIQTALPEAHVVKAFNSVGAGKMINPSYEQGTPTMFLCGNSAEAKREVGQSPFSLAGSLTIAAGSPPPARLSRCASSGACAVFSTTNGTTRLNS